MHDYEQLPEKDYMGTIGWSKMQCGGPQNMFGSEIKTNTPIRISITSAHVTRRESDFYVSPGDKHYVEVELTPVLLLPLLLARIRLFKRPQESPLCFYTPFQKDELKTDLKRKISCKVL